jgi:hypothetical protein
MTQDEASVAEAAWETLPQKALRERLQDIISICLFSIALLRHHLLH